MTARIISVITNLQTCQIILGKTKRLIYSNEIKTMNEQKLSIAL